MKKVLKWVGIGFAALLGVAIIGAWAMFGTFVKAANSIEKLEDGLYSMEFTGDYGFDEFLAQGGADSDSSVADFLVSFLSHGFYKNESKVETGSLAAPQSIRRIRTVLISSVETMTGRNAVL